MPEMTEGFDDAGLIGAIVTICFIAAILAMPLLAAAAGAATIPATQASDPAVDWLLAQPIAPTTRSLAAATQPASVFRGPTTARRTGMITLSDGRTIHGRIDSTPEQPLRFLDADNKQYRDVPLAIIDKMAAHVLWERQEPEWNFAQSGSDVKVYTGKTYPNRETEYIVSLNNGQQITGSIAAPLYITTAAGQQTFILHQRDRGPAGDSLDKLVYVKSVEFSD
jgi:hypothetical protein